MAVPMREADSDTCHRVREIIVLIRRVIESLPPRAVRRCGPINWAARRGLSSRSMSPLFKPFRHLTH